MSGTLNRQENPEKNNLRGLILPASERTPDVQCPRGPGVDGCARQREARKAKAHRTVLSANGIGKTGHPQAEG